MDSLFKLESGATMACAIVEEKLNELKNCVHVVIESVLVCVPKRTIGNDVDDDDDKKKAHSQAHTACGGSILNEARFHMDLVLEGFYSFYCNRTYRLDSDLSSGFDSVCAGTFGMLIVVAQHI